MKKYKWLIIITLLLIMLFTLIFLGSLKMKNIDMTDTRLLITYWKEYLIGTIITMGCYLGMKFVLENK